MNSFAVCRYQWIGDGEGVRSRDEVLFSAQNIHAITSDKINVLVVGECSSILSKKLLKLSGEATLKQIVAVEEGHCKFQSRRPTGINVYYKAGVVAAAEDHFSANSIDAVVVMSRTTRRALSDVVSFWSKIQPRTGILIVEQQALQQNLFPSCSFIRKNGFVILDRWRCPDGPALLQPVCDAAAEIAKRSYCPGKRSRWEATVSRLIWRPQMTLVNVGANKGYNVAEFLQTFTHLGRVGATNKEWHDGLIASDPSVHAPCGICRSTCSRPAPAVTFNTSVEVHAIELLQANVDMLRRLFVKFVVPGFVHHAAVLNRTGHAYAPVARAGDEKYGVQHDARGDTQKVSTISIDEFVYNQNIRRVSLLDIDAEGADALVLEGSAETLRARKVDILKFEYHGVGAWSTRSVERRDLSAVVARLFAFGYECFFDGNNGQLAPISDRFWCEALEVRMWSNVVCAHDARVRNALYKLVFN
jgi:FkbM family methyltransferase